MKKGNMKILTSVFIIASIMFSIGLGTMAYFSDTAIASGNTFTAGYMDMRLSSTGEEGSFGSDSVAGIWVSPGNWAPGDKFEGQVWFRNDGNVPVQVVLVDLFGYTGTPWDFSDKIEVTRLHTNYDGWEANHALYIATWPGKTSPLTLTELMNNEGICDFMYYKETTGQYCPDHPECGASNANLFGMTLLAPGDVGWIFMEFKFSNDASDTYQNAVCSFDLKLTFVQGPDSGICRHEMPGFVAP